MCEPEHPDESICTRTRGLLVETRRAEALALLEANQHGRARAAGVLALATSVVFAAGALGIATRSALIAIPLPTLLLLMSAELFQVNADLTVVGTGRRRLESLVNAELGGDGLIYETMIAGIRKRRPLVLSERLLQASGTAVLGASIVVGGVVAWGNRPVWVQVLYPICTAVALAVALLSYRAMLASGPVAEASLDRLDRH